MRRMTLTHYLIPGLLTVFAAALAIPGLRDLAVGMWLHGDCNRVEQVGNSRILVAVCGGAPVSDFIPPYRRQ